MCINNKQLGISLIELILFIVIVSIALASLLAVLNITNKGSVDPMIRKQALAIAESLLEEVELQDFAQPTDVLVGGTVATAIQANRASFKYVQDYNNFSTTGIYPADGGATKVSGLDNYNVSVLVANPAAAWGGIPASDVAQITVTVTPTSGQALSVVGYRVNY
jgi:MSHA pilin protein MshD